MVLRRRLCLSLPHLHRTLGTPDSLLQRRKDCRQRPIRQDPFPLPWFKASLGRLDGLCRPLKLCRKSEPRNAQEDLEKARRRGVAPPPAFHVDVRWGEADPFLRGVLIGAIATIISFLIVLFFFLLSH